MNNIPESLKSRANHLQKLISIGENIEKNLQKLESELDSEQQILFEYNAWFQRVANALKLLLPSTDQSNILDYIHSLEATSGSVAIIRGRLHGFYMDINQGHFNQLVYSVQKEDMEDLLTQADHLMNVDGIEITSYNLAVISIGITLEHAVRKLCERKQIIPDDGKWKSLGVLLSTLKEKKFINEYTFNQLNNWKKLRNNSAHGNFDHVTEENVRDMIDGVKRFVKDHL